MRSKRLTSLITIAIAGLLLSGPLLAQDEAVDAIEPQPLTTALAEFAEQTGMQLVYPSELTAGVDSDGASAEGSPDEILGQLLASTGLEYEYINDRTIAIAAQTDSEEPAAEEGLRNPGNVLTASTLTAQASITNNEEELENQVSSSEATSAISGNVFDGRTAANLKGALVKIEETGDTASTDDLGKYRFSGLRQGRYTLTVSYLGYASASVAVYLSGENVVSDIVLRGGTEFDEFVVYGTQSARAQSLNRERTSANSSTVLAADVLGQFNGTTISEALRRAPGIAFIPDPVSGNGTNIIIRGLEPDLNQVMLNGQRLLDGTGLGRSPDLGNILTDSIESVTINKTLLPSHDSNGAGGLVEIETKAPLDRARRFVSFTAEYGEKGNSFGDEFGISAVVSGSFGADDQFGASLAVGYREDEVTNLNYSVEQLNLGRYLPLDEFGFPVTSAFFLPPETPFPFIDGVAEVYPSGITTAFTTQQTDTLSITGGLQKQFGDHTDIRLDITHSESSASAFDSRTRVSTFSNYDLAPIAELGGEQRAALVVEDVDRNDPFGGFVGIGIPGDVARDARFSPINESSSTGFKLRGTTVRGEWSFGYSAGYTRSESVAGRSVDVSLAQQSTGPIGPGFFSAIGDRSFFSDAALANVTADDRLVSAFAPLLAEDSSFVLPLFSQAGFDFYNDISGLSLGSIRLGGPRRSEGDAITLEANIKRSFSDVSFLGYIDIGVRYSDSTFSAPGELVDRRFGNAVFGTRDFRIGPGGTLDQTGLTLGPGLLTRVGAGADLTALTRGGVASLFTNIDRLAADGTLTEVEGNEADTEGQTDTGEKSLTAYLEAELNFGKLQIIGGFRAERVETDSRYFSSPFLRDFDGNDVDLSEFGEFLDDSIADTIVVPRILANLRVTDNMIFRGSYYQTISPPQLFNLTRESTASLDQQPANNPIVGGSNLRVSQGNPGLKDAVTHNFGLDWEWYSEDIGAIKVSVFHKLINDPLQGSEVRGGVELIPADLVLPPVPQFQNLDPDLTTVEVQRPENSERSHRITGYELSVERQLSFLPDAFDGLGLYANYSETRSRKPERLFSFDAPEGFIEFENVPFGGSPEAQGTFGLTYQNYDVDVTLFYSWQDRSLSSFREFFVHNFNEEFESLDLRGDYFAEIGGRDVRFFFRAENLLEGDNDTRLRTSVGGDGGVPKYYTSASFLGGRSFFLGMSFTM